MKLTDIVAKSCRVCLKRAPKLRSLYKPVDEGEDPPNEMLRLITGIELESPDIYETLPKCICKNCELSLSLAYEFRAKVLRNHDIIEIYRKRIWGNDDADLDENESLKVDIKEEIEDYTNSNEFTDEISINEDNLLNSKDMKVEMLELSATEIETIDIEEQESNEDSEEECKPEYLDDEELYNNADAFESTMLVEDENSSSQDEISFNSEHENPESNDHFQDTPIEDTLPEPSLKTVKKYNSDIIPKRGVSVKSRKSANQKVPIEKSLKNKEERIPRCLETDPNIDTPPQPDKNKQKTNSSSAHICDICGNIFPKRGRMMEHRRRHDKELRFACELCDKRFHLREKLRKHMFLHTGGKPYKCSFCSRTFFYESVKKAHEAVHSGIKPFVCDVCSKAFAYAHALSKHKLIHADIKLYHCKYCDKDFRLQHHMKQHIETKLHQNAVLASNLNGKSTDVTMSE